MRELNSHKVNPANDVLEITVLDEPGAGGACHTYLIEGFDCARNPGNTALEDVDAIRLDERRSAVVMFQNGPIAEVGVNGITHEVLLAILIDRLQSFTAGPYACAENLQALQCLETAQKVLHDRTLARMARGVEGTHKV